MYHFFFQQFNIYYITLKINTTQHKCKIQPFYGGGADPRKDSCSVGTEEVEIQTAIDLTEYNGLWPANRDGKPKRQWRR